MWQQIMRQAMSRAAASAARSGSAGLARACSQQKQHSSKALTQLQSAQTAAIKAFRQELQHSSLRTVSPGFAASAASTRSLSFSSALPAIQVRSASSNGAVAEQESDDDSGVNSSSASSSNGLVAEDADDEEPGTHLGGGDDEGYLRGAMPYTTAQQHGPWNSFWLRTFSTDSSRAGGSRSQGSGESKGAGSGAGGSGRGSSTAGGSARKGPSSHWTTRRRDRDEAGDQQQQRASLFPKVTPGGDGTAGGPEAPPRGAAGTGTSAGASTQGTRRSDASRVSSTGGAVQGGRSSTGREPGVGWSSRGPGGSSAAGAPGIRDGRPGAATPQAPLAGPGAGVGSPGSAAPGALTTLAGGVGLGDADDTLELRLQLREAFLSKPSAIPEAVREVMYQHRWDKLLVDARRSVSLKAGVGKQETYTAMVAVGNMKGLFGLGMGDAATAQEAVAAAYMNAFQRLEAVPLYRGHTIYNHIEYDYNKMTMILMPRPAGWGIKCANILSELCGLAGIKDISIKVFGRSKSRFYMAAAFKEALSQQSVPHDGVEGSGVYVREVLKGELPMGLVRDKDGSILRPAAQGPTVAAGAA